MYERRQQRIGGLKKSLPDGTMIVVKELRHGRAQITTEPPTPRDGDTFGLKELRLSLIDFHKAGVLSVGNMTYHGELGWGFYFGASYTRED